MGWRRTGGLVASVVLLTGGLVLGAAPGSEPTTREVEPVHNQWLKTAGGELMLRSFDAAPYPHASRADGFKSKNGDYGPDHYQDSTVGIYLPRGYRPGERVDYVVHFHGWNNHVSRVLTRYLLPEQMDESGANAILLVVQGPKDANDSGDGKLELDENGFKTLIGEVTEFLNSAGKIHTQQVGHIALTAHSGGYKVTASILHRGGLTDHITDVILLDASYGNLEWFADYAKRPGIRLVSFHTKHLDDANTELMGLLKKENVPYQELPQAELDKARGRGIFFISTDLPHDEVPMGRGYFRLMVGTSDLEKKPAQ